MCWEVVLNHGQTNVMVIPAEGGSQGMDENTPLLVRTFVLTSIQARASRRKSLVVLAMQHASLPKFLPPGLAIIEK